MSLSVLGPRLAECRKKKNLSQLQVAQALQLNRATISAHEKHAICPSVETLGKLARLYGVSVDYLLAPTGAAPKPGGRISSSCSARCAPGSGSRSAF